MNQAERPSLRRHIMVTGCAGFVGKPLCRELIASGESIIGLYHQKLPEALDRMMPLCADLLSPEALLAPLRSVDCVVHLGWSGGILGAKNMRTQKKAKRDDFAKSANVLATTNLVRAMERQGVKRVVFLSWIGADHRSEHLVLREKYWAENVILNSRIPEKIIVRSGLTIDLEDKNSEFAMATQRLTKLPLFLPLPSSFEGVAFTSKLDLVKKLASCANSNNDSVKFNVIEDVKLTSPVTASSAIVNLSTKWWGQDKWLLGGALGRYVFALLDSEFGRLQNDKPKIEDFLKLSSSGFQK